ncbi:hypothetical protein SAMN02745133_03099 [Desulforamulus putei DSM 12395]|uniref:Uncharacterized protein n=1 Tax=Desulforamulus putei DSM 12395 TaxID=1121429 RepID=A0A1M5D413_9FIRM|nr:hypothetical protein [Desulforamulus putei]SHF61617.1 hypothetical protein SAMN02745133_03099 [Desulforamulus putei DSM 12395]
MEVYISFGDYSEQVAEQLCESHQVVGVENTLDGVLAVASKTQAPEVLITNGTVLSGLSNGKINRGRVMLEKLDGIRNIWPKTKIVLILPENTPESFQKAVSSLGIYNIHLKNELTKDDLLKFIVEDKSYISPILPTVTPNIEPKTEVVEDKPREKLVEKFSVEKITGIFSKIKQEKHYSKDVNSQEESIIEETLLTKTTKTVDSSKLKTTIKTPTTILGLGNQNLNEWFKNTFSHTAEIVLAASSPEEFRTAVQQNQPDIAVIMRAGPTGGLPYADELAVFSCQYARHVIFIAGELDDEGKIMAETVKNAGGKVLSCPPGETISGEELVLLIQNTINETIYKDEQEEEITHSNEKNCGSAENFLQSISQVTDIFKKAVQRSSKDPDRAETEVMPINTARIPKHPSAITAGGVLLIVSPWRPGLAGRITAQAAKTFSEGGSNVAVICASGRSTAASWLGVTDEELILSDWRVPGSQVPVDRGNIKIWAVDPAKSLHMNIKEDLPYILKEARSKADYTVIDFGEDIDLAQSYIHQKEAVLLCVVPGSDPVEQKTSLLWLKRTLGQKENIVIGFDLREQGQIPEGVVSKLTITTTPEEALQNALKKNLDQYIWNEVIG